MIIRDDLKNSDFYTKAMENYKENVWQGINKQLFMSIFIIIIFSVFVFVKMGANNSLGMIVLFTVCVGGTCIFCILFKLWQLTLEYDICEIYVGKKWANKVYMSKNINHTHFNNVRYTYWISEENDKWNKVKKYRILDSSIYNAIEENKSYMFLVRNNTLYDVFSII